MSSTPSHFDALFDTLPVRPDRRAHARSYARRLAYVQLGDESGGIALNMSEGGMAITTAEMLTSDYFPNLRIQLPTSDVWIQASGRVAWAGPSKKEAGIEFVDLADGDREKICKWIANNDAAQGQARGTRENGDKEFTEIRAVGKPPKKDRKLEVLSEADEAKFAGMFPSEKSLTNVPERGTSEPDSEPRLTNQSPRNILRFSGQTIESGERTNAPETVEPADQLAQPEPAQRLRDIHFVADETPRFSDFSKKSSIVPAWVESRQGEQQRSGESEPVQSESAKFERTNSDSGESDLPQTADFPKEYPPLTKEASENEAKIADQQAPKSEAYISAQEPDLIQQLEMHRRNRAARFSLYQAADMPVQRKSGWLLLWLILFGAIACFAIGIGVGNGFFSGLIGRDQQSKQRTGEASASSPAATPAEKDSAASNPIAEDAKQLTVASPNDSAPSVTGQSPAGSGANSPARSSDAGRGATASPKEAVPDTENAAEDEKDANSGVADAPAAKRQQAATSAISPTADASIQTAEPFSETQGPVLVTAPNENSGPFRLTLTEQAVSASPTLAISAQRSVSIPAQPGPSSAHRPERLQVGVLIYHTDPQIPAARDSKKMAGTVKVRATIGKGGNVVEVNPLSGPIPLIPAVVQAVREWRYTVTLLDGQPLGAEEEVVVEFRPKS
jgi:hypothetical protein